MHCHVPYSEPHPSQLEYEDSGRKSEAAELTIATCRLHHHAISMSRCPVTLRRRAATRGRIAQTKRNPPRGAPAFTPSTSQPIHTSVARTDNAILRDQQIAHVRLPFPCPKVESRLRPVAALRIVRASGIQVGLACLMWRCR